MKRATLLAGTAVVGIALLAGSANAAFVDSVGDTFDVNWSFDPDAGGSLGPLTAEATFTVLSFSNDAAELGISISNTTNLAGGYANANVVSFGFYASPSIDGVFSAGGEGVLFDGLENDVNFPGGFNSIDVCLYAANNCQGGNINDGLTPTSSDSMQILLTALNPGSLNNGLTLTVFPIKFQTSEGSFEFAGDTNGNGNGTQIPEPAVLSLLGAGLLGLGLLTRRRRR